MLQNVCAPTMGGGEYTSNKFAEFCHSVDVKREFTVPETPEQNGVAERYFRTSIEMARCLLLDSHLPSSFWVRAVDTAVYIRNRCPSRANTDSKSPFEVFYGKLPKIDSMRVFGCAAYPLNRTWDKGSKLDSKAHKTKFVGYDCRSPSYLVYNLTSGQIEKVRNVRFNECDFSFEKENCQSLDYELANFHEEDAIPDVEPVLEKDNCEIPVDVNDNQEIGEAPAVDAPEDPVVAVAGRPRRNVGAPQRYDDFIMYNPDIDHIEALSVVDDDNPVSYEQVLNSDVSREWQQAMQDEYDALVDNETWNLVPAPSGRRVVGGKWVYKVKRGSQGEIDKYKARYVAQGFSQVPGLEYKETYAPTARPETIRTVFALTAQHDCILEQMDVKSAYLHSKVDEEIYLQQPRGFEKVADDGRKLVCKLQKSIYGLKQAAYNWNQSINAFLVGEGFNRSKSDSCLYVRRNDEDFEYIVIWVDDIIICGSNRQRVDSVKGKFCSAFKMEDKGSLKWFLGMAVVQSPGEVSINQSQYITSLLNRFGMSECKGVHSPGVEKEPLTKSQCPEEGSQESIDMKKCDYRGLIGALLYLAVYTRPDVSYSVGVLSQFLDNPGSAHWIAAKRVLRYLKCTIDCNLTYRQDSAGVILVGASDADWAGNIDDRKSMSGYVFKIQKNGGAISWRSQKQAAVALSSTEAEYVALAVASQEAVFLRQLLEELGFQQTSPTFIGEDNQSCISITNRTDHKRTKHVDIKFHFLRDFVAKKIISIGYIPSEHMVADVLTKHLGRPKTDTFRNELLGPQCNR